MLGCSSSQNDIKTSSVNNNVHSTDVTLSHVKAYLLIGNIQKAEQLYQTIDAAQLNTQSMLTLAELHAAKGNSVEAQKVFLAMLTDSQFDLSLHKENIPAGLLDYFCEEKKWPALQGYGAAIKSLANTTLTTNSIIKNDALTKIGLCFFYQQRWQDAKYWLEQVALAKQVNPLAYLALARANVEQQQYSEARSLITQYEQKKDTVDAQTLWVAIEVYLALKQTDMVTQVGENMRSLFPYNQYTRKYILLTKRGRIQAIANTPIPSPTLISNSQAPPAPEQFHTMKKGETLYQLSKRYDVSIADLLNWNPDLVVDDISLGTSVRVSAN
jgi:Tfp pilus assembly protein PilF